MARQSSGSYLKQMQDIARERGARLLSPAYLGDAVKLRFRCRRGHEWAALPAAIERGSWCPGCRTNATTENRRTTAAGRLRRMVAGHGGAILSPGYVNRRTRLRFRCARGHEWETVPGIILQGHWCRRCWEESRRARVRERLLAGLRRVAGMRGGQVVAASLVRPSDPAQFRCARGHTWRSLPQAVMHGAWCPTCRRNSSLEPLRSMARDRGGALLSDAGARDAAGLRFRCAEGHEFVLSPGRVRRGHWCPRCGIAGMVERSKAPARARLYRLVAERGGAVLSPAYIDSMTKLRFRCRKGHEWETVPLVVLTGSWCPVCAIEDRRARRPAPRRELASVRLSRIVSSRGGQILPPGYANCATRMPVRCARGHAWQAPPASIDKGGWCPKCKEEELLALLRAKAEEWGGACLAASCRSGNQVLSWQCAVGHLFLRTGEQVKRGFWCPTCRGTQRGSIERMRQIARERGGECLSAEYVDAQTSLRWRCRRGHQWEADPGDVVKGSWCPECARTFRGRKPARLSIEIMRQAAAERGGACLSRNYYGNKVRLRWRCARGHTWMAHPNRILQRSWCPVCAHSARGTLEGMRALAVERGGRCLSATWNDHREPLRFECRRGHRFKALGVVVKTGVWCPECREGPAPPPSGRVARPAAPA